MTSLRVASRFVASPSVFLRTACALFPALAAAQDCPPVPQPGCSPLIPSALVCSTEDTARVQIFDVSTYAQLLPRPGCTIVASAGSVLCAALVNASAVGSTQGACGMGQCSEADGDGEVVGNGGDLLGGARSATATAAVNVGGVGVSTSASATIEPLSMETHWVAGEFSRNRSLTTDRYAMSPPNEQDTEIVASAEGHSIAGGGFSTTFAPGCSGVGVELTIVAESGSQFTCSQLPHGVGCEECRTGLFSIGFVGWSVDWGSSETIVQGVIATRILEDGTLEPVLLGAFDSPDFQSDYAGNTLFTSGLRTLPLTAPPGTQIVGVNTSTDSFYAHDGDIDGDGFECAPDKMLMESLIGIALGNAGYTPRADFDLDGLIEWEDLERFYDVFEPLEGDVNGDCCVNIQDHLAVLAAWGPCPAPPGACAADIDGDGMVGITDLLVVLAQWNQGNCP
jgi:hypothetical protein